MLDLINKTIKFYKKNKLKKTALHIIHYINKKILLTGNVKEVFDKIYIRNFWGSAESVSGPGSEALNTIKIRSKIISIIKKFRIKIIVDAPCGDFNYMKLINKKIKHKNIKYIGIDIVDKIIKINMKKYSDKNIKFLSLNILDDPLPTCDLLICRDFLQHLSNQNILKFKKRLMNINFKYLLITSHQSKIFIENQDIADGDFRHTNLLGAPLNFPKPVMRIKDYDFHNIKKINHINTYLFFYKNNQFKNL